MASSYIEEMRSIQNRGPYFLAGFCMGGGIAFEMAQQLKADGESIGMVAMLDSYNVGGMHPNFGEGIIHLLQTCWFGFQHFLAMDRAKKLEFVKRHFDGMRIPESEVSRINTRAALSYYPKPYSGRLLQIHPEHRYALYEKAELAWNKIADDFELLSVPCYPGQMFEGPFVRDIAQILRSRMDQVCGGSTAA
jgi:thioesterase domain-containing protein